jgi:hypothetical protein
VGEGDALAEEEILEEGDILEEILAEMDALGERLEETLALRLELTLEDMEGLREGEMLELILGLSEVEIEGEILELREALILPPFNPMVQVTVMVKVKVKV